MNFTSNLTLSHVIVALENPHIGNMMAMGFLFAEFVINAKRVN